MALHSGEQRCSLHLGKSYNPHCSAWAEGDIRFHLLPGTKRYLFISYLYFLPSLHGSRTLCHLGTNHNISFALLSPSLAQTLLFTKTEQS